MVALFFVLRGKQNVISRVFWLMWLKFLTFMFRCFFFSLVSRKGNYFSAWCLFCFIQFIHSYCKGKVLVLAIFLNVYNTSLNSRRFKSVPVQTNWILPWSRALEAELKPQKQLFFVLVLGQPLFGHDSHYRSVKLKVQGSTDGSISNTA